MKKVLAAIFLLCSSLASADTTLDKQIIIFESSCIEYYNGLIERKLGEDKSPESRKKWEDILYKDYRFAKDAANPEPERLKAIQQANLMCTVQQRMKL